MSSIGEVLLATSVPVLAAGAGAAWAARRPPEALREEIEAGRA